MKKAFQFLASSTFILSTGLVIAQDSPLLNNKAMGQALYEQSGSNSCMFCHGIAGKDGKVAQAANLTQPKSWRSWKAMGGDGAFNANKAEFLKNFEEAVIHLIAYGAIGHNKTSFDKPWFNWGSAGSFNGQMQGLKGTASAAWMKRMSERGVTSDIAAKNVYLYIQNFDTQGVFK